MCQRRFLCFPGKKARLPEEIGLATASMLCNSREKEILEMQNAIGGRPSRDERFRRISFLLGAILLGWFLLYTRTVSAVTLAELQADSNLTPERLMKYFADFKFKQSRNVRQPEVFLETQTGDCDDFATLAAALLRQKGYTTRLMAVFMAKEVHVVCYVNEIHSYLDYNRRKNPSPLVKCEAVLSTIGATVAASFRTQWRSVSEFTFQDGIRHFVMTEFH
jgi:hypothetical protein